MLVLIVLIVCVAALLAYYMYLCNANKRDMFDPLKYGERIRELELKVKYLDDIS